MSRVALAALAAVLVAAPGPAATAEEMLIDGIAAQVGSDVVLISDVMRAVRSREAVLREAGAPEVEIAKLRADGLEQMIEWRLIERVVRQTELYASDEEINRTIESIANENGLSVEQLEASVVAQGMTFEDYRDQIKRELERHKVVQAMVSSKVRVDESELKRIYQQRFADQPEGGTTYHLRQIMLGFGGNSGRSQSEARAAAEAARARIAAGEPFEVVAEQVSDIGARTGGDIGWLHEDSLAGWMRNVVEPLKEGQVSKVVELPFGCTVLKLVERKDYAPISFEQARRALHSEVFEEKVAEEFGKWMEELRKQTYIERYGYFADAAQLGSKSPYSDSEGDEKDEKKEDSLLR